MDAATEHAASILKVAWARSLGIGDRDIAAERTHVLIPEITREMTFLNLFGASVFLGPEWAVERAAKLSNEALGSERGLLEVAKDRAAHRARAETILFTPDYLPPPSMHPSQAPLISREREMAERLERLCPPDDVAAADLDEQTHWFTLLEETMDPVACAAYREWQGFVANMTALTVADARRQGYAKTVALIATNVALDEGLVPQWRAHRTNTSAWHLAEALGFHRIGVLATVSFG
ncbi:GNAT family N-acetyltransferase [Hoyosella subflava]|uniref:Acetyltransferase n=1 Tax=Hoyosella subflava (strain DSM 45089 / JCM 17490 / NBRC 109087 / DQS3-9A1) TaxID=443218 RepID=F6EPA4_HOYSD|nr:GNAT family N-acetyltransferase [Hoyosella subflava]AEF41764.1 Acetyltransferase [Hoyosella subflava DQS3-9A1]